MKKTATKPDLKLFDTHCHFDFDEFAADFPRELAQASNVGVERILIPSVGQVNWQRISQLAAQYPSTLLYALGFHPYFLDGYDSDQLVQLERQLSQSIPACVAIGECGLDGQIDIDTSLQEKVFITQLSLATQAQLPVILHSRKTHNRLLQLLKQHRFKQGGVLHAFSGSQQQAQQFIDLGFKVGVGGVITYPRANKTRQAISQLPVDSLVLETDAPDMPLCGQQGEANHPKYLPQILDVLADLRGEDKQQLAQHLWDNSVKVFRIEDVTQY